MSFFMVFMCHPYQRDVDLDIKSNIPFVVFCSDQNVFGFEFCIQLSCEKMCNVPAKIWKLYEDIIGYLVLEITILCASPQYKPV